MGMVDKKLLERLLVDEQTVLERLVAAAEGIVGVDRGTGEPLILAPRDRLTDREQIFLMLLGRYFSYKLEKSKSDSLTTDETASRLGLNPKAVSARLSELKREKVVDTLARGEYRVVVANAESVLLGIKDKLKP